jgi:hypothetical protein
VLAQAVPFLAVVRFTAHKAGYARVTNLEQKLGIYTRGPSQTRRNAALDILTGRPVDGPRALDDRSPDVKWSSETPAPRLHLVEPEQEETNPAPAAVRRSTRWTVMVGMVVAVASAGVLLAAGFGLRGFMERPAVAAPAAAVADVTPAVEAPPVPAAPMALPAVAITPVGVDPLAAAQVGAPAAVGDRQAPGVAAAAPEAAPVPAAFVAVAAPVAPPAVAAASAPAIATSPTGPLPANMPGLLVDERFTSTDGQWPNDPQGTAWFGGGSYRLAARHSAQFVAVGIPGTQGLGDTVVTGWFRKVGGLAGGGYGLILRDQDPQALDGQDQVGHFYVFEVGDRGEVGVWLRDGQQWLDLLTWTPSQAVKPGLASNELTVAIVGDHLSFVVNGIPVASQTDTLFHSGAAGVFVGGDSNEVAVDRIAVSTPH